MQSYQEVEAELDRLIERHYYAEDYELRWALHHWQDALPREEQHHYHEIALRRLGDDPSIMSVVLCSASRIPEAVPMLTALLQQQTETSVLTRAILDTLERYGDPSAFSTVERFLDSDQEIEALQCLAKLHFARALFFIIRSARRPHLRDVGLQILHDRKKDVGLDGVIEELNGFMARTRLPVKRRVRQILGCKKEPYQPFAALEIEAVLNQLGRSGGIR